MRLLCLALGALFCAGIASAQTKKGSIKKTEIFCVRRKNQAKRFCAGKTLSEIVERWRKFCRVYRINCRSDGSVRKLRASRRRLADARRSTTTPAPPRPQRRLTPLRAGLKEEKEVFARPNDLFDPEDNEESPTTWCALYGSLGQRFCHTSLSLRDEYAVFCRDYIKNCGETRNPDHSDLELHARLRPVLDENDEVPEAGEVKEGAIDKSLGIFDPSLAFGGGILDEEYQDGTFGQLGDLKTPDYAYDDDSPNRTWTTAREARVLGGRQQQDFSDMTGFEFNSFLNGGGLAPTNQNGGRRFNAGQFYEEQGQNRRDWGTGRYGTQDRWGVPLFGNTFTTYIDDETNVPVFGGGLDAPVLQGRREDDGPFWEAKEPIDIDWLADDYKPKRRYYFFGSQVGKAFGQRRIIDDLDSINRR